MRQLSLTLEQVVVLVVLAPHRPGLLRCLPTEQVSHTCASLLARKRWRRVPGPANSRVWPASGGRLESGFPGWAGASPVALIGPASPRSLIDCRRVIGLLTWAGMRREGRREKLTQRSEAAPISPSLGCPCLPAPQLFLGKFLRGVY